MDLELFNLLFKWSKLSILPSHLFSNLDGSAKIDHI